MNNNIITDNDKSINKKRIKAKKRVLEFLEKHRYNDEEHEAPTHRSYGMFNGNFHLDKETRKDFMRLYVDAIEQEVNDFSILEVQKEYSAILVDIDLEVPKEDHKGGRLYDNELVLNIINKYIFAINTYLDISKSNVQIIFLEKDQLLEKEFNYRDGFHLYFDNVCASAKIRHLIRHKVVEMCNEEGTFEGFTNSADKIIDKAVVSSNGWFLYGSSKPNSKPYIITKMYDAELNIMYNHKKAKFYKNNKIEDGILSNEQLIECMSLQGSKYSKKKKTPLLESYNDSDVSAECERLGITSMVKSENKSYVGSSDKDDEIRKAITYTNMLSHKRSDDYHDWLRVGLALHNVDESLLVAWIDFSKKCSRKYKEGECDKIWRTMKNHTLSGSVLTIRSLAYWAKLDDPKQYLSFIKEEFQNNMRKCLDGNTYYLAKCVHSKYADRFVCSSVSKNIWWEFRNHRWVKIDDAYTLKNLLSEDFANEYNLEIADVSIKATQVKKDFERDELRTKRLKLEDICKKLMSINFKEMLIKECRNLFYDSKFEDKLDSNVTLIGFENGIYDLVKEEFRDGRPDDYVTLSTKVDYVKWNDKNPYYSKIMGFFSQVITNVDVRKYFMVVLSTCVSGETKEEKFYVFTGSGSNGKSLTNDLMKLALGDYYMPCDISIITRKRGDSNGTSPEKVRMRGKRCGVFQEADEGEKVNVGVMKELTGGDTILIRDLYKGSADMLELKPQMKYFLTCNKLPAVPANDDGTWRRLRVIDFNSKFKDNPDPTKPNEFLIDTTLKQKIQEWAPSFASLLIHIYCTQYKSMKYLKEPTEVMTSTNQYKMENDFFTEYVHERITKVNDPKKCLKMEPLWTDFKAWYNTNYGGKMLPKKTEFVKNIATASCLGPVGKKGFEGYIFNGEVDNEESE